MLNPNLHYYKSINLPHLKHLQHLANFSSCNGCRGFTANPNCSLTLLVTLFYETLTYFITVYNELEECAVISEEIWLKNERERESV